MRIALIAYACHPDLGSEPGAGWQWARHLADRGHRVDLVTRNDPLAAARLRDEAVRSPGLTLHVVPQGRASGRRAGSNLGTARRYLTWLANVDRYATSGALDGVDVVHHVTYGSVRAGSALLDQPAPLVFGPVAGGHRSAAALRPLLGRSRGTEWIRDTSLPLALRLPGRARRTLRRASMVLASNSDTATLVAKRGSPVALVLADGLPGGYLSSRPVPRDLERPTVLWVGSLQAIKAPVLALRAFDEVRRRIPTATMRIIGDGPLRGRVLECRDALGLSGLVSVTGRLPWSAVVDEYDAASVLLFTSVRDAFGVQSLEAWGRGLPSVGFRQHGLADFAPEHGTVLVDPCSPATAAGRLADAVCAVLADPRRHAAMSAAALTRAGELTWSAKVAEVEAVYTAAVAGGA